MGKIGEGGKVIKVQTSNYKIIVRGWNIQHRECSQ